MLAALHFRVIHGETSCDQATPYSKLPRYVVGPLRIEEYSWRSSYEREQFQLSDSVAAFLAGHFDHLFSTRL